MSLLDDETTRLFVEESREHLASIENDLLAMEEDGADIDEQLVNKVFRAAHSLKGGAGFLGLIAVKELAHRIENVLDLVRSRQLAPTPGVVSVLLRAFDRLRDLINDVETSNDQDVSAYIAELTGVVTAGLPQEERASVSDKIEIGLPGGGASLSISAFDLAQARKGGNYVYFVEYDLIHDVQRKDRTPLDVLRTMMDSGKILESAIDFSSAGTLDEEPVNRLPFYVLFATIVDPDLIGVLCRVPPEQVRPIEEFEIESRFDAETTSPDAARADVRPPSSQAADAMDESIADRGAGPIAEESFEAHDWSGAGTGFAPEAPFVAPSAPAEDRSRAGAGDAGTSTGPETGRRVESAAGAAAPCALDPKPSTGGRADQDDPAKSASRSRANGAGADHGGDATLRVNVALLETLMNLAGELVLSRNQLLQSIGQADMRQIQACGQRLNLVVSELQEAIMLTRMQPIGSVFAKFPRLVRDVAKELGKDIRLIQTGKEVELDKTIVEALSDPLTHLVRNAVDHGVESPDVRLAAGKSQSGQIFMRAYHEAGQVIIEIADDGKGLDGEKIARAAMNKGLLTADQVKAMTEKEKRNLVFLPGLSTVDKVSDLSGRGVGMDVVKTNLDRLGGQIDIVSEIGKGATFRIRLPLTLAIIPSLLVSVNGERFALPQVNVRELIRIPAAQVGSRIKLVGEAETLVLRGELIPLAHLGGVLGVPSYFVDPATGEKKLDRRGRLYDRRLTASSATPAARNEEEREPERRYQGTSDVNVVIVSAGSLRYGLVVEELHDTVEIVVKPLGRRLKHCRGYAGATILGDGKVALILDASSLADAAGLAAASTSLADESKREAAHAARDVQSALIFQGAGSEQCAVPLELVERVEQIEPARIEMVGGRRVCQYRGGSLPLFALSDVASVPPLPLDGSASLIVIVFRIAGREIGLLAAAPVDAVRCRSDVDSVTLAQPGVMGSVIVNGRTTLFIDVHELVETIRPEWFESKGAPRLADGRPPLVLLAEDSEFFRGLLHRCIEGEGYRAMVFDNGGDAWNYLRDHGGEVDLVVTDIEMPNMDGFELTRRIRSTPRLASIPVIAVTSLTSEEDVARGKDAGISEYQIKFDKERLRKAMSERLRISTPGLARAV